MVDDGRTDGGRRTDDGRQIHWYTISSPCEPNGSGELKSLRTKSIRPSICSFIYLFIDLWMGLFCFPSIMSLYCTAGLPSADSGESDCAMT